MAGHFLLRNISQMNLQLACTQGGAILSNVAHTDVPLSATSSQVVGVIMRGGSIPARTALPRHLYIQFSYTHPAYERQVEHIRRGGGWVDYLQRPTGAGVRPKGLCLEAQRAWSAGKKRDAVLAQMEHSSVSIEIYFVDGVGV